MSKQIDKTQALTKIKTLLERFERKEPYISNTALRIYDLLFDKELFEERKKTNKTEEYITGYNSGYVAGSRRAKKA